MQRSILFVVALLLTPLMVQAQQSPVWKYVDAQTFAVIRLDITKSDYKAASDWVTKVLKSNNADPNDIEVFVKDLQDAPAKQMLEKLQQAGAKELYGVLTLSDIPSDVGWVIIPIPNGANGAQIARALVSADAKTDPKSPDQVRLIDGNWVSAVVNDVVFYGRPAALDRISKATVADRPELAKALADAGDSPLVMGLAPSSDTRKVVEQMLPNLPPPAGVPSTVVTHGLMHASFAVDFPPTPKLSVKIQSDSPAAAKDFDGLIARLHTVLHQDKGLHQQIPVVDQVLDAVTPKLDGDHLTVALESAMLEKLGGVLTQGLAKARENATRVASMNNLRQLSLYIIMYRNDHKGAWPETLDDVVKYTDAAGDLKKLTTNPRWPDRAKGYVYVKPTERDAKMEFLNEHALIYEAFDKWPGFISVAFGDGHVEGIGDEARFKKLVAETKTGPGEGL